MKAARTSPPTCPGLGTAQLIINSCQVLRLNACAKCCLLSLQCLVYRINPAHSSFTGQTKRIIFNASLKSTNEKPVSMVSTNNRLMRNQPDRYKWPTYRSPSVWRTVGDKNVMCLWQVTQEFASLMSFKFTFFFNNVVITHASDDYIAFFQQQHIVSENNVSNFIPISSEFCDGLMLYISR